MNFRRHVLLAALSTLAFGTALCTPRLMFCA